MSLTLLTLAYVTYQDIRKISGLKDQTVIVVKAPPETRLEVPDSIEVRRQRRGPSAENIPEHLSLKNPWLMVKVCSSQALDSSSPFILTNPEFKKVQQFPVY